MHGNEQVSFIKTDLNPCCWSLIVYLITIIGFLFPAFSHSTPNCQVFYTSVSIQKNIKWEYSENHIQWIGTDPIDNSSYYAVAGINRAGILYLNLKLVSEDGTKRTTQISGKEFVTTAVNYFKQKGHHVTGLKGWWIFRSDSSSELSLSEQVDALPNFSINFHNYWNNRKQENDYEAAKQTWTAKIAAQLGFTEVARVSEYAKQRNYHAVFVTFLPKDLSLKEIKKAILKDKEEIEISLESSFRETRMGEEVTSSALGALFRLNIDQATIIKILEENSQIAADFKALGFKIVGAERRKHNGNLEIFIRIR